MAKKRRLTGAAAARARIRKQRGRAGARQAGGRTGALVITGLDELQDRLAALADEGAVDRAANAAAERIRDEVSAQPWGRGNWQFPVDTGALRASGRVEGSTLYWDDLTYAGIIESRSEGFFAPKVREVGPEIFEDELTRELDAAIGD